MSENNLKMEQKALEILEEKVNNQTVISGQPIGVLKSKVPVTAKVDELILDIERAEVISSSRLISVKFNDESVTGQDVQEKIAQTLGSEDSVEPEEESETEGEEDNVVAETEDEEVNSVQTLLPEGINRITAEIEVEVSRFEQILTFIEEIEQLNRVIKVDSIEFEAPDEKEVLTEKEDTTLLFNVKISTFYLPMLAEFENKLNQELPEPAKKKDPFHQK